MKKYNMAQKLYDDEVQQGIYLHNRLDEYILSHINWIVDENHKREDIIDSLVQVDNILTNICRKIDARIEAISRNG